MAVPPRDAGADERVARLGLIQRLIVKPEFGFAHRRRRHLRLLRRRSADVFRSPNGIANWLDPASTLGIMAVAVALLMIGGHFDLSAGVQTGTAGLVTGDADHLLRPEHLGRAVRCRWCSCSASGSSTATW